MSRSSGRYGNLSAREYELLALAAAGRLDKQACQDMGISPETIRTYWKRIRAKLGDQTRGALIAKFAAESSGLTASATGYESIFDWEIDLEHWTYRRLSRLLEPEQATRAEVISLEDILVQFHPDDELAVRRLLEHVQNSDLEHFYYIARTKNPPPRQYGHAFALVLRGAKGRVLKILGRRVPLFDLRATSNDPPPWL